MSCSFKLPQPCQIFVEPVCFSNLLPCLLRTLWWGSTYRVIKIRSLILSVSLHHLSTLHLLDSMMIIHFRLRLTTIRYNSSAWSSTQPTCLKGGMQIAFTQRIFLFRNNQENLERWDILTWPIKYYLSTLRYKIEQKNG